MARPIPSRPLRLDDAGRDAWAEHLARNKAAHESYRAMPDSFNRAGPSHACAGCGKETKAVGVCKACRGAS